MTDRQEQAMAKQVCIYCWKTAEQVSFNREHVIPYSIMGRLVLENYVCAACNSWLGSNVDDHILRLPAILTAVAKFADTATHDRVLKHNYNVKLVSESGSEFVGHASAQNLALLTQQHPIHGMIYSETSARESLRKTLERKHGAEISKDGLAAEADRIAAWMTQAEHGEEIQSPFFETPFRKYAEMLQAKVEPRTQANIAPLIAKIAYEFIFITSFKKLFTTDDLEDRLRRTIAGSTQETHVHIHRLYRSTAADVAGHDNDGVMAVAHVADGIELRGPGTVLKRHVPPYAVLVLFKRHPRRPVQPITHPFDI